ncbi:MAG: Rpn family recombination-promoting nuclease/putative transposase [Chthoniobacterales bacterium]
MSFPSKPENNPEKKIHAAHDLFFRKTMSNPRIALEFFETHLPPEIFAEIDSGSLYITKESFIDGELLKLKHAFTRDVIVCIQQLQELLQAAYIPFAFDF